MEEFEEWVRTVNDPLLDGEDRSPKTDSSDGFSAL